MAHRIIVHRQQRKWARRIKNLVSDMIVQSLVPKHRDKRLMIVFPARDIDSRGFPRRRIAPVGGDQQRRGDLASILECYDHSMLVTLGDFHSRFPQKPYVFSGRGSLIKRGPQVAVLVHEAEWLFIVGIKVKAP